MSPRRGVRLELTELAIGDLAEIADDSASANASEERGSEE